MFALRTTKIEFEEIMRSRLEYYVLNDGFTSFENYFLLINQINVVIMNIVEYAICIFFFDVDRC